MQSKLNRPQPMDKAWLMEAQACNMALMASQLMAYVGQPKRQGPSSKILAVLSIFPKRFKNCRKILQILAIRSVTWI